MPTSAETLAAEAETAAGGFRRPRRRPIWNRWSPGSPGVTPAGSPAGDTKSCWPSMLGLLLYRLGKNFFYDSWLAEKPLPFSGWSSTSRPGSGCCCGVCCCCGRFAAGCVAGCAARLQQTRRRLARCLLGRGPVRRRRRPVPPRGTVSPAGTRRDPARRWPIAESTRNT